MQPEKNNDSTRIQNVPEILCRREALKRLGTASIGIMLAGGKIIYGQTENIDIAGGTIGKMT